MLPCTVIISDSYRGEALSAAVILPEEATAFSAVQDLTERS